MEIAKAKKNATILSNDAVFAVQLCELLVLNPLYKKIMVLTTIEQSLFNEKIQWIQLDIITESNSHLVKNYNDLFCRIINKSCIENYNNYLFQLIKSCSILGYARIFVNIDLAQYLQKGSITKLFGYQELEEQILKLPFWSTNLFITVKTKSAKSKTIETHDILKSGGRYIGMRLLSSLGLPLIVISSSKIAKAMNYQTSSLSKGDNIYHSGDIQKILNNEKNRN